MRSLAELEDRWSIDDLLDANIAIDLWDEVETKAHEKAEAEAARRRQQAGMNG